MEATSPLTKHHVGQTFIVAVALLGVIALIQLVAVFWVFISRYRSSVELDTLDRPLATAPIEGEAALVAAQALPTPAATSSGQPEATPAAPPARPTPVPAAKRPMTSEARLVEMIQQARALRERGDTATALTRLREALAISPNSALILSEVAITYEKLGQEDKATETWHKIYDMGETAGIYYSAAEAKLRAIDNPTANAIETSGFQAGSTLGIVEIAKTEVTDPATATKFTLRIPIKAKPNVPIDVRDVVIQVYFYDIINDQDIVQTNANVSSFWSTLPADWSDDDIEVLEVEYSRPKASGKSAGNKPAPEARKYYGYVVRVYYRNELQDMRAEPVTLLKKYPPPVTLQTE